MVWNVKIEALDSVARPIIVVGRDFPDGYAVARHNHRRGQLISSADGLLTATTPQGTKVMSPGHGMWIPSGVVHEIRTIGKVMARSLFLDPSLAAAMPADCTVVSVSPLMRELIASAIDLPVEYDPGGFPEAVMILLDQELQRSVRERSPLAMPRSEKLASLCRKFLEYPSVHVSAEEWSARLGMSTRTFTRFFRRETGTTFMVWKQQACVAVAQYRLNRGQAVTAVALDLGYENPAAFSAMFKRATGLPPMTYMTQCGPGKRSQWKPPAGEVPR